MTKILVVKKKMMEEVYKKCEDKLNQPSGYLKGKTVLTDDVLDGEMDKDAMIMEVSGYDDR